MLIPAGGGRGISQAGTFQQLEHALAKVPRPCRYSASVHFAVRVPLSNVQRQLATGRCVIVAVALGKWGMLSEPAATPTASYVGSK